MTDPRDALIERLRDALNAVFAASAHARVMGAMQLPEGFMELLAEADEHLARPVAQQAEVAEFFSYDHDGGFDTFATADEARKSAEESLAIYRDDAPDGWNEHVESVCWGVVIGSAEEFGRRPVEPDDLCAENCKEWVDYRIVEAATPTAQAAALPEVSDEDVDARLASELRMYATAIEEAARGEGQFPNAWHLDDWMHAYRQRLQDRMKEGRG